MRENSPMMSSPSYPIALLVASIVIIVAIVRVIKIFVYEGVLQHIQEDWTCRLPHRLRYNRYKGLSRPCYALLCYLYYPIKDAFLLLLAFDVYAFKFMLWDFWKWLLTADKRSWFSGVFHLSESEDVDDTIEDPEVEESEEIEELPFCQLFRIGQEMCLLVDHIEMCPDETAFIRVVDDEGYTPLYKRKVRRDKTGNRFIVFNGTNYYLDNSKTQPDSIKN